MGWPAFAFVKRKRPKFILPVPPPIVKAIRNSPEADKPIEGIISALLFESLLKTQNWYGEYEAIVYLFSFGENTGELSLSEDDITERLDNAIRFFLRNYADNVIYVESWRSEGRSFFRFRFQLTDRH